MVHYISFTALTSFYPAHADMRRPNFTLMDLFHCVAWARCLYAVYHWQRRGLFPVPCYCKARCSEHSCLGRKFLYCINQWGEQPYRPLTWDLTGYCNTALQHTWNNLQTQQKELGLFSNMPLTCFKFCPSNGYKEIVQTYFVWNIQI